MGDLVTQLGVGGIFAILILQLVFSFLKTRSANDNVNGNKPISRDEFEKHKDAVQYRDNCDEIVKRIDWSFAKAEATASERMAGVNRQFGEVKSMIGKINQ